MEVKLYVNGFEVNLPTQPQGLEDFKVSLKRDTVYSGIDTDLDVEIKFYCTSGKTELDTEYQANGLDSDAYIEVTDTCGTETITFKYKLDFKNFNSNDDYCTCGLIQYDDVGGGFRNWKESLKTPINLSSFSIEQDLYVRNLPLKYNYESENVYSYFESDQTNEIITFLSANIPYNSAPPVTPPTAQPPYLGIDGGKCNLFFYPKTDQIINELENSDGLVAGYVGDRNTLLKKGELVDIAGVSTLNADVIISEVDPTEVFHNVLANGEIDIVTGGGNTYFLDFIVNVLMNTEVQKLTEIIVIGKKHDNPRTIINNVLSTNIFTIVSNVPISITTAFTPKTLTRTLSIQQDEKLWIYYAIEFKSIYNYLGYNPLLAPPNWEVQLTNIIRFKTLNILLNQNYNFEFTITENTISNLAGSTLADIEPYHTKVKAFRGLYAFNNIFNTDYNFCQDACFEDIWFTDGQRMRNKINRSDFIVKPQDIFSELEKITCCGLGVFYTNLGVPTLELRDVYSFYSDTLVYSFNQGDISGFKISNINSNYYNELKLGYSNFKDSSKDYCKTNEYSIDNKGESIYNKVAEWIASKFIITKALKLATDDKELEFDKNIFLLSATTVSASPSDINFTLAESSGVSNDSMFMNPNVLGLNRRYASVMNLFRHLYKWGFSLFADKNTLKVNKYEGSIIYNEETRNTAGIPTDPNYQGLSSCKLPMDFVKVDRDITGIYTSSPSAFNGKIQPNLHIPMSIEFEVYNLTSIDLLKMRYKQYGLFKVTNNGIDYYGNLMTANHDNGVTKFNLLRRFKNGL